jgi:hypothetical protein
VAVSTQRGRTMGMTRPQHGCNSNHIWISQPDGGTNVYSDGAGRFTIVEKKRSDPRRYLQMDAYSAAMAFVQDRVEIHGDLFEAIRYFSRHSHSALRQFLFSGLARIGYWRTSLLSGYRRQTAKHIQFHYDRSNRVLRAVPRFQYDLFGRSFLRPRRFALKMPSAGSWIRFARTWRSAQATVLSISAAAGADWLFMRPSISE